MDLILVRHALPVRAEPVDGVADPGLADRGREQAARLPEALRHDRITAAYTSPAARARQTGEPVLSALGLEATVLHGIAEFDHGSGVYVPVEELKAANDPMWQRLQAGQLYTDDVDPVAFRQQVVDAVEQVVADHPGETVVLFTHAGAVNAYTGHLLEREKPIWFAPDYAGITRIRASRDGRRAVRSLNETGHVRDLL